MPPSAVTGGFALATNQVLFRHGRDGNNIETNVKMSSGALVLMCLRHTDTDDYGRGIKHEQ